jgi:ferrous iron transport protein A
MIVTLRECPENTKCELIDSDIPDSLKSRLMGLGWLPGKTIQVVRRAPMGDPTIFLVDSTKIFLREEESRLIKVRPLYPAPLAIAEKGIYKVVKFFGGGPRFVERAKSSGIFLGEVVEVISNPLKGKILISTKNGRVAIGRGFSEKIFVEPVK